MWLATERRAPRTSIFYRKFGVCSPRALFWPRGPYQVSPLCDAPAHNTDHQRHPTPQHTP